MDGGLVLHPDAVLKTATDGEGPGLHHHHVCEVHLHAQTSHTLALVCQPSIVAREQEDGVGGD